MKRIAIFASGSGSNAERIATYFSTSTSVSVDLFLTNNPDAGVIERGRRLGIPILVFDKKTFSQTNKIGEILKNQSIDLVVLGGFLWLVPPQLIAAYPNRIINIHPALLPKYGGKGMWGHHVHEAVVKNKETTSGITIHYVNEHYDEGQIIAQYQCNVSPTDSPEEVARKVQVLEHEYFPLEIEKIVTQI